MVKELRVDKSRGFLKEVKGSLRENFLLKKGKF
jgi:hypothetical protein